MDERRQPHALEGFETGAGQVVDPVTCPFWIIHAIQNDQPPPSDLAVFGAEAFLG